jgi:hypothetical protein
MYKAHDGNCLQCALSYLLDVDLRDIADVQMLDPSVQDEWFDFMNGFLRGTQNKELVQLAEGTMPLVMGIAILEDMNWGTHAVVIDKNDSILWDPNPEAPIYNETVVRLELGEYIRDKE